MRNTTNLGNALLNNAVEGLRSLLPDGWRLTPSKTARRRGLKADTRLTIRAPDGARALLLVEAKRRVTPRQAAEGAAQLTGAAREGRAAGALLISDFLSELSRKRLRKTGVNYLDLTGNAWIALERPGLLIDTQGSAQDPSPSRRGVRSMKGTKVARVVRALCDVRPPIGVRELARLSGTDPGYVSRILQLLVSDDLIQRGKAGQIAQVDWQDLIRRWGQDYSLARMNRVMPCLAPRGLESVTDRLRTFKKPYALTGTLAVPPEASVAAVRLGTCYVDDPEQAARFLDVRPAGAGANILLLEPYDRVVYDRTRSGDGLTKVALSQCAVDLLTSGGRGPAEADSLLTWMAENEDAWRS